MNTSPLRSTSFLRRKRCCPAWDQRDSKTRAGRRTHSALPGWIGPSGCRLHGVDNRKQQERAIQQKQPVSAECQDDPLPQTRNESVPVESSAGQEDVPTQAAKLEQRSVQVKMAQIH